MTAMQHQSEPPGDSPMQRQYAATLQAHGLDPASHQLARVARVSRRQALVLLPEGSQLLPLAPALCDPEDVEHLASTGDWLVVEVTKQSARGVALLPRQSAFIRRRPGKRTAAQVVCANVDLVFVVTAAGRDLNPRRLERYLLGVATSGARPVVLLNKVDRCEDADELVGRIRQVGAAVEIRAVSALRGDGVGELHDLLIPGTTVAFVGSSGVGKSTLINRIRGDEALATAEVRPIDDKGRHTTTERELLAGPDGVWIIDTPGMRELGLWAGSADVDAIFPEVQALAAMCCFRDCGHESEPDCAVLEAVKDGELADDRLQGWRRLQRERAHEIRRADEKEGSNAKRRHKWIAKEIRKIKKMRGRQG